MRWKLAFFACLAVLAQGQTASPEARARQFIELMAKQDFTAAQAMLDAEMGAKLPVPVLQQTWAQVRKGAGEFRRMVGARTESSEASDVVFVTCEFEKAKLDARLPVNKAGQIGGLNFALHVDYAAPEYVDTASFHEKEVMVGSGEWALHGTLTIPNGDGPFPALVLVHGSGPNDRDAAIGPNKPFRDIAWGAASRGVAVLRYNKRTNEHPLEFSKLGGMTVKDETIDDALAAAALLRGIPGIDAKKIFVLGHSLGGTLAPRIGKADPAIAGLIVLGGTTHALVDLLVPQTIHNFTLRGPMTAAQQKYVDQLREQVARANDPNLTPDTPASQMPMGLPASYILDLRGYHPEEMARELKQPMLILQGERDYQVTMEDFDAWRKGLAGKRNVEFRSYPKLNHLFMPGEGISADEEYAKPGHVLAAVVEDIASWVKRQ
ncbi:MAG TPA: alpha/beta fold hydrolase [Bryobacteraceae bacterium]|nr:alpha/beta fold hydrolase [Bryobacteraceae bacterium]